jgi:hypothetical protein
MNKRALLVGIDTYDYWEDLSACVKDVQFLAPRLTTHEDGTANFSVTSLVSSAERIDRPTLMRCVRQELVSNADVVLLYFAGHGAERAGDVILCTQEGNEHDEGVAFSALLGLINASGVEEVIVILDCCFSGGAGSNPVIGSELSYVRPGVAILSASRHDEVAQEMPTVGQGRFSYFLCAALDGGAADVLGNVGVIGAYAYLRESFGAGEQSPTFKCNVAKLHRLRRCHPAVSHAEMLRLPEFFGADPAFELRLSPAYEPTSPPSDPVKEKIFGILQRYRAAKLVEPVGVPHMYDAAMASQPCRLTALGRHYRHLAYRGLL